MINCLSTVNIMFMMRVKSGFRRFIKLRLPSTARISTFHLFEKFYHKFLSFFFIHLIENWYRLIQIRLGYFKWNLVFLFKLFLFRRIVNFIVKIFKLIVFCLPSLAVDLICYWLCIYKWDRIWSDMNLAKLLF